MQKPLKYASGIALMVLVGALVVGCGSSSSSSSSSTSSSGSGSTSSEGSPDPGLKMAEESVNSQLKRPTKLAITEPLKSKPEPGKKLVFLPCGVPAGQAQIKPVTEAAEAVGWTAKSISTGLTPESTKAAWEQAVREEPDAVAATCGFPTAWYEAPLKELSARGIPIVTYGDPTVKPANGITGVVNGGLRFRDYLGPTFADWVADKSGGDGHVLFVWSSGFPVLVNMLEGYKKRIAEVCPECETEYFNAPASSVGTTLAGKVASVVQAHPDTEYVIGGFNDLLVGVPSALKGAGVDTNNVHLIAQNLDGVFAEMMANGEAEMNMPNGNGQLSWQIVDVILRQIEGQPSANSQSINSYTPWIMTDETLPEEDFEEINPVKNYKEQFEKLWHVG